MSNTTLHTPQSDALTSLAILVDADQGPGVFDRRAMIADGLVAAFDIISKSMVAAGTSSRSARPSIHLEGGSVMKAELAIVAALKELGLEPELAQLMV